MQLFRRTKKQPIKLRGFKYIDVAKYYPNICYYFKELPRDNFEILTCALEGTQRKPEIGAGSNVKVIDVFMANHLYNLKNDIKTVDRAGFIDATIKFSFSDIDEKEQKEMVKKFNSTVPKEVKDSESYKKAIAEDFKILYCSNDESKERAFGVVNLVLYKDVKIESKDERIDINSSYTCFRPLKFMTSPLFLKGKSKQKYNEIKQEDVMVDHDLLI